MRKLFGKATVPARADEADSRVARTSTGFRQFAEAISFTAGKNVLDLGSTSSANIQYLTGLGHRVYNEDVLAAAYAPQLHQMNVASGQDSLDERRFLAEGLQQEAESLDAVLLWDVCDYMPEPLVRPMIERIHFITRRGGILLAFFHTRDSGPLPPYCRYHIRDGQTLELQPGPDFQLQRIFQNRHVENLFHEFGSIKFFLGKENIREVLIVR